MAIHLRPFIQMVDGNERLFADSLNNPELEKIIRQFPGAKWSTSLKLWHFEVKKENIDLLVCKTEGLAVVDMAPLKIQLTERKQRQKTGKRVKGRNRSGEVIGNQNNLKELERLAEHLRLKGYSQSTIRTYTNEFSQLLYLLRQNNVQDLEPEQVKRYLAYCLGKGISENTIHSRLNALKFYFEQVLKKDRFFFEIPRPKKPMLLPKLLNETELSRLFNSLKNKKHKAMLFTVYSAGLRVSELTKLKLANIDSNRMQIHIENAKGKKDRYVNLSPVLLDVLREYVKLYRPGTYLFESGLTCQAYPVRTVQQIFSNAKNLAGIRKQVGIHSLRHSFATHLLDKGTDIRYIKELLGHFNIRTTERYLHVSRQQLVNIISPFDDLIARGGIEW